MKHRRNTWRWLVQKREKGGGRKLSDLFLAGDNKSLGEATRISGEEAKSTSMEAMLGYVFLLRGGLLLLPSLSLVVEATNEVDCCGVARTCQSANSICPFLSRCPVRGPSRRMQPRINALKGVSYSQLWSACVSSSDQISEEIC